jgi:hypothetical protein
MSILTNKMPNLPENAKVLILSKLQEGWSIRRVAQYNNIAKGTMHRIEQTIFWCLDLYSILLRFREHKVAFTADISQMYRQIQIQPQYYDYQRFVWRFDEISEIQTYRLKTVTFGVSSAPYLAIRTLHQLASDERHNFPNAYDHIMKNMYVDDLLSGSDNTENALKLKTEISECLARGTFSLRKWASNEKSLLPNSVVHTSEINLDKEGISKTLGIIWNCNSDHIQYRIKLRDVNVVKTKRVVLSLTAQLFDPLGLIAPVVVTAKIFLQKLWTAKLEWDEKLPNYLENQWDTFVKTLSDLNDVIIPRCVIGVQTPTQVELHGFCDSSQLAYGASIFVKSFNKNGDIQVRLLTAKSRVAPIKTQTLPRLELCGAVLVSELMTEVKKSLNCEIDNEFYYTDSTIVLSWLAASPNTYEEIMGNLPDARVNLIRPFRDCGVDYAGPISIREGKGRGKRSIKAYVCLFICLATKAIHLELVTDCTSSSFIGAFKRFMSRRGKPSRMYSDNATTFKGSDRELRFIHQEVIKSELFKNFISNCAENNVEWHFIPPRSPHVGGIWEAGIKSMKFHFKRIIGQSLFTYEEMYTCLTLIEACLNSRPITPLSSNPDDLSPLTPGHFLIGTALTAPAESDVTEINIHRLDQWQKIQQVRQHFWKRWSREYIVELQQRSKWATSTRPAAVGDIVIVHEDNIPPLCWSLGRIEAVQPGRDGKVRTVSVRTKSGVVKRSVHKLSPLPV